MHLFRLIHDILIHRNANKMDNLEWLVNLNSQESCLLLGLWRHMTTPFTHTNHIRQNACLRFTSVPDYIPKKRMNVSENQRRLRCRAAGLPDPFPTAPWALFTAPCEIQRKCAAKAEVRPIMACVRFGSMYLAFLFRRTGGHGDREEEEEGLSAHRGKPE